jgi:PAS domain S-box-containing protein
MLIDHFAAAELSEFTKNYQFIEVVGEIVYGETFVPFLNGGRGACLWCTASPLYDAEGHVVGAIESLRDVTYRKKSESALREGEERYRRLVETLNDGMGIVDTEGQIVFVNDRLCEMTGYAREELVFLDVTTFLPQLSRDTAPIDWPTWDLAPGEAMEFLLPCRNGDRMPVRVSPSALYSEDGDFQGGFAVITDMTSIREAEARFRQLNENLEKKVVESTRDLVLANEALRSSESRYRRIIESLSEGYIFYSMNTRREFTYISPSSREVLGFNGLSDTFAGFQRWYGQERNAGARLAAERTSLGFKQPAYDLEVAHADGSPRVLEILEAPVFSDSGCLTSVEGIMHDVTEQRRNLQLVREAQAKLIESAKLAALGGLMAGLSHEINTPIGIGVTASSHLDRLNQDCEKSYRQGSLTQRGFEEFLSSCRESAELIQSNLTRAADLLQNFQQVAVDQSAGQLRNIELASYLQEIIHSLSPRLKHTGFRIHCECPPGLQMRCEPGALYQILSNLVLNSLNHGFDGLIVGEISISARREQDQVVLEYHDNGNGMTREQVARIYEPFYTTRRGQGGTGLGMHIVYTNVTQTLGGKITCASRPGRGARFTIAVPLPAEVQLG